MDTLGSLRPPTTTPRRRMGLLIAASGVLLAAFFVAPNALARGSVDTGNVGTTFRHGLAAYWNSGSQEFPRPLDAAVSFWFRFHVVKAGVSALLLAAVVVIGIVLWRLRRERAAERTHRSLGLSWTLVAATGTFALVALVANVQGAAAPFASLLPMLSGGGGDAGVETTVAQAKEQLATYPDGRHSPALIAMIDDFALYHAVLAGMAAVLALALAVATVILWRRRKAHPAPAGTRARRRLTWGVVASATLAAVVLVVAVANAMNAADSPQALAAFFEGSW
ncbi:tat (twin-arginine translocation) pathway signal sequence [Streptomyces sp. NPDC048606]|uniref:tat (twin-arginine translocation) pathway signal sequence n=1 Tax=Streptomyces sp. NPDC048606 TaxID=3154726 RepID=UPI003448A7A0